MSVVAIVLSYLLGSISFSTLITRRVAHVDIRNYGSGNAGATNTLRVIGVKWGIAVFLLDICKGVVVALAARWIPGSNLTLVYLCCLAVIAGHNWPVFFRFRGGKGVATTIGVLLTTMFHPAIMAGIFALALVIVTRYVSLGSLSFTVLTPVFVSLIYTGSLPVVFAAVLAAFSVYRHRENIVRLWKGTERRLLEKSPSSPS